MKRHLALVGLLLAAAGCAAKPSQHSRAAAASPAPATITATDAFRFAPGRITVSSTEVAVHLKAAGSYPHNISFPALHLTSATVGTAPGDERTAVLRLHGLRPGVYRFICTFHSKAGMTGELVVK